MIEDRILQAAAPSTEKDEELTFIHENIAHIKIDDRNQVILAFLPLFLEFSLI